MSLSEYASASQLLWQLESQLVFQLLWQLESRWLSGLEFLLVFE